MFLLSTIIRMKGKDDDCASYFRDNFGYLSIICFKFIFLISHAIITAISDSLRVLYCSFCLLCSKLFDLFLVFGQDKLTFIYARESGNFEKVQNWSVWISFEPWLVLIMDACCQRLMLLVVSVVGFSTFNDIMIDWKMSHEVCL